MKSFLAQVAPSMTKKSDNTVCGPSLPVPDLEQQKPPAGPSITHACFGSELTRENEARLASLSCSLSGAL